jgi:hypothetical protein
MLKSYSYGITPFLLLAQLILIPFKKFETGAPKTPKITAILGAWLGFNFLTWN